MRCPECGTKLDEEYCEQCGEFYCPVCNGLMELVPVEFSKPRLVPFGGIEVDAVTNEVLHCPNCTQKEDETDAFTWDDCGTPF